MCGVRIYAGRAAGSLDDLHALEVSTLLWTDLTNSLTGVSPGPSYYASLLPAGDRVYLFGGLLSGGTGVRSAFCDHDLPPAPAPQHCT